MMGYYGFGYGMGFLGWTLMVLFWIAVVWLIVALLRRQRFSDDYYGRGEQRRTPQEILKERYAKGEITKKEYEDMRKDIM